MASVSSWIFEEPRCPAESACRLARSKYWREGRERFIGSHKDWPDAADVLALEEDFAHGFVLALSTFGARDRRGFADAFYEVRHRTRVHSIPLEPRARLAIGAAIVLDVASIIVRPDVRTDRILDLLQGASQRDDLTSAPPTAVAEIRKVVARIKLDTRLEDENDPRAAAALALVEVLDPAGEIVATKEVFARSVWAAANSWERSALLGFLLRSDRLIHDSAHWATT